MEKSEPTYYDIKGISKKYPLGTEKLRCLIRDREKNGLSRYKVCTKVGGMWWINEQRFLDWVDKEADSYYQSD